MNQNLRVHCHSQRISTPSLMELQMAPILVLRGLTQSFANFGDVKRPQIIPLANAVLSLVLAPHVLVHFIPNFDHDSPN